MRFVKGGALHLVQTILYSLCLCAAGIVIGIYGYFLAYLGQNDLPIPAWEKAVEGISGAAVLYTLINAILTFCLAGSPFLAMVSLVLDICFVGGFTAIAVLTRQGASSCSGYLSTPLGKGLSYNTAPGGSGREGMVPFLWYVCSLNKAVFAISIIATVIFFTTAVMQVILYGHYKRRKSRDYAA